MYFKPKVLSLDKSPYSPHMIVPQLVTPHSYVLDVGCNIGYIGKYLKKNKNCICDGIDIDEALLAKARPYYRNLFKFDLFKDDFVLRHKYDFILFIDILEHLPTPHKILKKMVKNLRNEGRIIICLPNIARVELRLKHLFGNFDYKPGIMNEDHLRFFTLETGKELIEDCGLEIEQILPTGLGARIKMFPRLIAFQFIYTAYKK